MPFCRASSPTVSPCCQATEYMVSPRRTVYPPCLRTTGWLTGRAGRVTTAPSGLDTVGRGSGSTPRDDTGAWAVDFAGGAAVAGVRDDPKQLRLVRDAP